MLKKRSGLLTWLGVAFAVMAWSDCQAQPTVYAVNYPLQYFAERIGGAQVSVVFPAPADVDPAFWAPDVETIAAFQAADLILLNGATYAKWLKTASLPKARSIDTSRRFAADYIAVAETATHSHGPDGEHSHGGTAFTTWLDLRQAVQQAQAVKEGLGRLLPDHREAFEARYAELEGDLLALDDQFQAIGEAGAGATAAGVPSGVPILRQALRPEPGECPVGAGCRAGRRAVGGLAVHAGGTRGRLDAMGR